MIEFTKICHPERSVAESKDLRLLFGCLIVIQSRWITDWTMAAVDKSTVCALSSRFNPRDLNLQAAVLRVLVLANAIGNVNQAPLPQAQLD